MSTYDITYAFQSNADGEDELIVKVANPDANINYHSTLTSLKRQPNGEPAPDNFALTVFVMDEKGANTDPFLTFTHTGYLKDGNDKELLTIYVATSVDGTERKKKKKRTTTTVHSAI